MKMSCNVIRDLMPVYTDQLCCEESKALVEEHVGQCRECQKILENMRCTMNLAETEKLEFDYMKKVKRFYLNKTMVIFGLLALMVGLISYIACTSVQYSYCYLIAVGGGMMTAAALVTGGDHRLTKKKGLFLGLSLFLLLFEIILQVSLLFFVKNGYYPFQLKASQLGPFLAGWLRLILVGFLLIVGWGIYDSLRQDQDNLIFVFPAISGTVLSLLYLSFLYNISPFDSMLEEVFKITILSLGEGILALALYLGIRSIRQKRASQI